MEARAQRIRQLFEGEQCLVVPVFQRPYVWNRVKNWEPLWADILTMVDAFSTDPDSEPHFLGAVVLDSSEKDSADLSIRQVIDGQQRVTTLQVVLCAVRDALVTAGADTKQVATLTRMTRNEDALSDAEYASYKVWPTLRDRAALKSIVDSAEPGDDNTIDGDSRLRDAFDYFYEAAMVWLDEAETDPQRVTNLVKVLRVGLQLVVIELTGNDNAQVIFESLNDRGTPLLPSDLVKNSLFQMLERHGADVERIFDEHWRRLETPFWQQDIRQGRLIRSRLDAFFAHFLTMRTGNEVLATSLFTRFKELAGGMTRDQLVDLTREIAENSDLYREIVDRSADGEHNQLLETADVLDTSVISPVVLFLDHHAAREDRTQAFGYIESWLVRRAVLRSTSKNYNRMLLDLLQVLKRSEAPYAPAVREFLLSNTSESGRWPTDDEIREALVTAPIFKQLTRARTRLILRGCEHGLRIDAGTTAPTDLINHDVVPLLVADGTVSDDSRGSIGNLSLISTPRPKGLASAAHWEERREFFDSSMLLIDAYLPDDLTEVELTARGANLAEGFVRCWPHPHTVVKQPTGDSAAKDPGATDDSDWVNSMWSGIRGFFTGMPTGTVSRVEETVPIEETPIHDELLAALSADPADGYVFREVNGDLYIEKTAGAIPAPESAEQEAEHAEQPATAWTEPEQSESDGRTRITHDETMQQLIIAGYLEEGDQVYHDQPRKGLSFRASIGREGRFVVGGREFASPSGALSNVVGNSRNGWKDWRLERTNETLEQVRERFRRNKK
ncbi:DUF262 domain-containing protein [Williamsia sp. DF01-3]|uniref:GmrSD restriction endonuclease domain-containing protein n=1 Tax=Williamsia sp. DF01-3 TaxID=2934157 RepID=UPI001FF192A3|nr:DUF262 domain-containing protein [Williamsia sp. DF01-3]MCK0517662.1 DUF262 domain-containing protein [Williamsia sp. DF01-3]